MQSRTTFATGWPRSSSPAPEPAEIAAIRLLRHPLRSPASSVARPPLNQFLCMFKGLHALAKPFLRDRTGGWGMQSRRSSCCAGPDTGAASCVVLLGARLVAELRGSRGLRRRRQRAGAGLVTAFAAGAIGLGFFYAPAPAQVAPQPLLHFAPRPKPPSDTTNPPANTPMLVQADEMKYDYSNNTVSAVGHVQIYYGGSTVEADQVVYDQKTKRLRAEGNARLTEPNGRITYGQVINLTDDYRDGFVDSLRLETPDDTHMAAARADRSHGDYEVLQDGVYTACEPCKDDPKKPPEWQIKAARIIHDDSEKMIYFENASVDFFGLPVAYFPFLSTPDTTV